jgi:hypothetical protein
MNVLILRVDGSEHSGEMTREEMRKAIGADSLDGFDLRDGRYVYVDDLGHAKRLPVNAKATALYHSICRPGTTWQIFGDVAIVRDSRGRES